MFFLRSFLLIPLLLLVGMAFVQAQKEGSKTNQPAARSMTLHHVLQQVINHYPSVKTAAIQVAKARQENNKVQSQLSWVLSGRVGVNRNTSLFGSATDRITLDGGISRDLANGGTLSFNGALARENASDTFGPNIPNPLTKTRVDINYRHPLGKGAGNPGYQEDLKAAKISQVLALSNELSVYDQLAAQVLELYLAAASTQARMLSLDKTLTRSERLKKIIQKETNLGLSEEKDVLQIKARLSINRADKISLQVAWKKQLISLNRLMGKAWDYAFIPTLTLDAIVQGDSRGQFDELYAQSQRHSPALKRIEANIKVAESAIRVSRERRKDQLDLVAFLGNEFNQGDLPGDNLSESEVIGGISLEFRRGLDLSGFDAALRQAHFDKGVALQDKKQILEDLRYDVASLLVEIDISHQALNAFKHSVEAEQKKLKEALSRFHDGRIETDRVIEFESQLATAELSLDLQTIELVRRYKQLNLLIGKTWQAILSPQFKLNNENLNKLNEQKKDHS